MPDNKICVVQCGSIADDEIELGFIGAFPLVIRDRHCFFIKINCGASARPEGARHKQ
jgi:hypothetical protein